MPQQRRSYGSVRPVIRRQARLLQTAVEPMESRLLFSTASVTNLGPATDSFGNSTAGWTGYLITVTADAGKVITAIDLGTSAAASNGIFATLLQEWTGSGGSTPTPIGTAADQVNGSGLGTDSHLLPQNRLDFTAAFEDNDRVNPTGAPVNTVNRQWGTGSYLHGVFGIPSPNQTNSMTLAYVVSKDGTAGSYAVEVAEATPGGNSSGTRLTGTFDTATTTATLSVADVSVLQPAAGQTTVATFTVTLEKPLASTVTVDANTADGTAVAGTDYDAVSTTLTFAAGETSKTVAVTVRGQSHTSSVGFTLNLSNPAGGATVSVAQGQATILAEPLASLSATGDTVTEPAAGQTFPAFFTLTLSGTRLSPVTVDFQTVDGTAIAGVDYDALSGTVTFSPGETVQTVTVIVKGVAGTLSDKTFALNLSNPVGTTLDTTQVQATIKAVGANIRTFDARHRLTYTDAAGQMVLMQLTGPGTGQAAFAAPTGDANPTTIVVTGSTNASSLIVRSFGGATTLPDVIVQGALGVFGGTANVAGNISITGGARVIVLGNVSGGHTMTLGQAPVPTLLKLGDVMDLSIDATGAIGAMTAKSWADTDATADTITATALNSLAVTGPFGAGLALSGNLGPARILGAVTGGAWNVGGNGRAIIAGSVASGWSGTFGGNIPAMLCLANFAGTLSAVSVPALRVGGDLSAQILLSGTLGTLFVGGKIDRSLIRTVGNITLVSTGAMLDTLMSAGLDPTVFDFPTSAAQFTTKSTIGTFAVRGVRGLTNAFANSLVAASTIRLAVVRQVLNDNIVQGNHKSFGLAAESLKLFGDIETGKRPFIWRSTQNPALLTFAGDFKVLLV